ncbi:SDR family NAD(P)-dependent oxidoreductase [Brenneria rubrifaciens]|uniref:SDR family oxidoreductase n=1 Tax=Brenneria rubrifaciens TaxID=55213 RepID=A0A4P8QTL9_9GAMM|nr:SDR family oxidoreductase [Brenneria rubrifaciens]QCR08829.1 SDR family oxidoreductase [Brenneria rubrifaciens]
MTELLAGKTAVVTGGATGIGHAIALALGRAGAHVVIGDLQPSPRSGGYDESPDRDVVDLLASEGHSAEYLKTDVTSPEAVAALAERALTARGKLDIWVNNAGIVAPQKRMHEYGDEELERALAVNTKGTWNGMRAAIRRMLEQESGGVIVNVLSMAAVRPHINQAVYDISKAASAQATRVAALEYGPQRIRVNGVCPTLVKTALSRAFVETPEFHAWFRQQVTLGEPVEQRQVADAVLFLASDAASAITGVLLPVDMGESLGPIGIELKQN